MFKARTSDGKYLKDLVTAIGSIIDEATFDIDENGIKLRAMDPSRVALVDVECSKEVFDELYECYEPMQICVNVSEFLKLLRRTGKTLELALEEAKLRVTIEGNFSRDFYLPTLEPLTEAPPPKPKAEPKVHAELTTSGFNQAMEDASIAGEHVVIEVDKEKISMLAKGDLLKARIQLKKESNEVLKLEVEEGCKSTYSLTYLSDIVKMASATSEVVKIGLGSDIPIILDFKQPKNVKLTYYLAPRIEVD